jgi:predicted DsbA family dithiol-disulfide isomerase
VAAVRVEIVSDLVCPWCFIGKRRFERALYDLRHAGVRLDVQVRWRAYQLDPTAPIDTAEPVIDAYAKKFGGYERATEILHHVTTTAAADGITFDMQRAVRANTLRAHRLLKFVGHHTPELEGAVCEAVMSAYFAQGLNIGDPKVLLACARRVGVEHEALASLFDASTTTATTTGSVTTDEWSTQVHRDLAWAAERDITAVPTFVINDSFVIPGAQDSATFARLLRKMIDAS